MLYIINCWEKPDQAATVAAIRETHQHYLHGTGKHLVLAGGMLTEDGNGRLGSEGYSVTRLQYADHDVIEDFLIDFDSGRYEDLIEEGGNA